MSLKYAILSILDIQPMTGYDLKHVAFDATVQHFWPADQAQIYRTLSRLADDSWATIEIEEQDSRPDRKVYSITEAGRTALLEWLASDQPPPTFRDPFLVQLFFGLNLPNEVLVRLVDRQLEAHRGKLATFRQIPIPPKEERPEDRWLSLQHMTLDFGRAFEESYIKWLEKCQAQIATLPDVGESS
jgi:DNA-binding PadR family transcriptional regulator